MDWQPIETAPKDETYFLGTDGERVAAFNWKAEPWAEKPRFWQVGCTAFNHDIDYDDYDGPVWFEPTHWVPLPRPPAIAMETRRAETSGSVAKP